MSINDWLYGYFPPPTEAEQRGDAAVKAYHQRCDAWDDANLTGRYLDLSLPSNSHERAAMTRNCRRVREQVLAEFQLTPEEWKAALRRNRHY